MTIHAAKGLEFPYVYIVGVEENLFPSQLSLNSRTELEEERRLFYVALTRAKQKAVLSYAVSRYRWGNFTSCEPSRFIEEIDEQFLEMNTSSLKKPTQSWQKKNPEKREDQKTYSVNKNLKKASSITKSFLNKEEVEKIKVGTEVNHEKFGKGKVLDLSGESPNIKATVFFPTSGKKQLLLKFAKLQILN